MLPRVAAAMRVVAPDVPRAGKDLALLGRDRAMRGKLDVDTLLKIVLILVAIWLVLGIVEELVEAVAFVLGPASNVVGLVVLLLIVLWLLDRI